MEKMLKGVPEVKRKMPRGIVMVDVVDVVNPDDPATMEIKIVPEMFYQEYVPQEEPVPDDTASDTAIDPLLTPPATLVQ